MKYSELFPQYPFPQAWKSYLPLNWDTQVYQKAQKRTFLNYTIISLWADNLSQPLKKMLWEKTKKLFSTAQET